MPDTYYLVITNIPSKDWVATLTETPQTLGRSRDSEIRVPSTCHSVSRKHAKVWYDRQGVLPQLKMESESGRVSPT